MNKTIIRCAGIVVKDNKILLVESNYGGEKYWILPGGGLEYNESIENCVKREVIEETNLTVKPVKLIFMDENFGEKHMIHFTYKCNYVSGELKIGTDPDQEKQVILNTKFCSKEEVQQLKNFIPHSMKEHLLREMETNFSGDLIHLGK